MRKYVVIEKKVGETPLSAIEKYRKQEPALSRVPMTYAGRLDPMASGKLIVLLGEECKSRTRYDGLDKTYLFEVLLGFSTDTGDVLGLPVSGSPTIVSDELARDVAESLVGEHSFPYPAFSSKAVHGKPLFKYALENTLSTIEIPTIDVRVYSMRYLDKIVTPRGLLIERILSKIELLKVRDDIDELGADFRKEEIMKRWWSLDDRHKAACTILRFETTVSSGTYIRTLGPLIAERLGTSGLAYSIRRTKVGCYLAVGKRFGIWTKTL